MAASAWMDRKTVMVMSTNGQPSSSGTVTRKQRDGSTIEVPCPESIISYNKFMGGVDRDQLRGYYSCRSRSRKFYKYIFLFDVAITNATFFSSHPVVPSRITSPFDSAWQRISLGSTVVADAEDVSAYLRPGSRRVAH